MRHTTNYNFALPDGADNVDVSILNGNMVEVERILNDIYSKLPTPPHSPSGM